MDQPANSPTRTGRPFLRVVLALLVVVAIWMLVEPQTLFVTQTTVSSPDVPAAFDGTRIVFLADVHAGRTVSAARVRTVLERALSLKPDLIVLGGDYVGGRENGARLFYPAAARLKAPLGVYAVLGNHDDWEGEATALEGLAADGIRVLDNTSTAVTRGTASITLAGVEDWDTGRPDVAEAGAHVQPRQFAILVSHSPDSVVQQLPASRGVFDLALAAHTHGGQVTFFGLWAPSVPSIYGNRYRTGWHDVDGTPMLVTNGTGTVWLPLRFFAPPQINVITLKRAAAASVR